jgi:hypothetical protein
MQSKENNKRCYYDDGFRMRAACVCVRNDKEDEVNILFTQLLLGPIRTLKKSLN